MAIRKRKIRVRAVIGSNQNRMTVGRFRSIREARDACPRFAREYTWAETVKLVHDRTGRLMEEVPLRRRFARR